MNIMKLIQKKAQNNMGEGCPCIAFLGDSVTQGCFEVYKKLDGGIETIFDKDNAYHHHLAELLNVLYPSVPIQIINAGISGDHAPHALERMERDVLRYAPDLVVVCLGLNDSTEGLEKIEKYQEALREIFRNLKEAGSEVIFMTPNMMAVSKSPFIQDEDIKTIAEDVMKIQNEGILEAYLEAAKEAAAECEVKVCDCYAKWKKLAQNGVNITELLANKINHPTREMNWLFAVSLMETMMEE